MFCEQCGNEITPGKPFCASCGAKINQTPDNQQQEQQAQPQYQQPVQAQQAQPQYQQAEQAQPQYQQPVQAQQAQPQYQQPEQVQQAQPQYQQPVQAQQAQPQYQQAEQAQPQYQQPEQAQSQYQQPVQAQQTQQGYNAILNIDTIQNKPNPNGTINTKKRMKVWPIVLSSVVAVLVLMGALLFVFRMNIMATVMGPSNYYFYLEQKNASSLKSLALDSMKSTKFSLDSKITASVSGSSFGDDEELESIKEIMSSLSCQLSLDYDQTDLSDPFYILKLDAKHNSDDIFNLGIESSDNKTKISFPGMSEESIGFSLPESNDKLTLALTGDDKAFEEVFGISKDKYQQMKSKYLKDIIFASIPNDKAHFTTSDKFEGISCNSIVFNLDEKDILAISEKLADEIEKDEDLHTLIKSVIDFTAKEGLGNVANYDSISLSEIKDSIKELCDELRDKEGIETTNIQYSVYFSDSGKIIARKLSEIDSNTNILFANYEQEGQEILKASITDDNGKSLEFTKKSSTVENIEKGDIDFSFLGDKFFTATYSLDTSAKILGQKVLVGNIDAYLDLYNIDQSTTKIKLSLNNEKKDDTNIISKLKVTTDVDDEEIIFDVKLDTKYSSDNFSKPNISLEDCIEIDLKDANNLENTENLENLYYDLEDSLQQRVMEILSEYMDY